jgi:glycosyltransferase involved in cell wall biosynthesis
MTCATQAGSDRTAAAADAAALAAGIVSLVVPIRNEAETIGELIESIHAQTLRPAEIVFVDGGSTDGTVDVIGRLTAGDPRVRVITAGDATPGRGRNIGIAHASFEWIALTDAGIRLAPAWLQALVEAAQRHPEAAIVYGAFDPVERTRFERAAALAYVPPALPLEDGFSRGKSIASALVRRDAWKAVGGFPDLRAAEDLMFMERLASAGYREVWAPRARVWWRLQPTLGRTWRRFVVYSRVNALAGRQRFWHYGVARQYVAAAVFVALAVMRSPWWLAVPVAVFLLRVARSIWVRRGSRRWWACASPAQFALVAVIICVIDLATFVGWAQALAARPRR